MKNKEKPARQSHWVYFIIAILFCLSFGYSPSASAENPSGFQKEHRDNMAGGCGALALNPGVSLNGFVNDQYQWYDSACHLRSAALARDDTVKGGNAKQVTYLLADGTTRTVNPGAN